MLGGTAKRVNRSTRVKHVYWHPIWHSAI